MGDVDVRSALLAELLGDVGKLHDLVKSLPENIAEGVADERKRLGLHLDDKCAQLDVAFTELHARLTRKLAEVDIKTEAMLAERVTFHGAEMRNAANHYDAELKKSIQSVIAKAEAGLLATAESCRAEHANAIRDSTEELKRLVAASQAQLRATSGGAARTIAWFALMLAASLIASTVVLYAGRHAIG